LRDAVAAAAADDEEEAAASAGCSDVAGSVTALNKALAPGSTSLLAAGATTSGASGACPASPSLSLLEEEPYAASMSMVPEGERARRAGRYAEQPWCGYEH
jgi:hypothetical protein